jgi:TRAP-type mannitol/chloroaromatic compound transport system permease large subunit
MGLISLPIMLRYGYDRRVASGVIAASGTLAQIIPPSLVLIVMADQLGKSVGDMYEGAFIPGLVLACLYALYIFIVTTLYPQSGPGLPPEAVGFKETSEGQRDFVTRVGALLALGVAGYIAWIAAPGILSGLTSGFDFGFVFSVIGILMLALLGYLGATRIIAAGDERGLISLLGLTVVSGLIGFLTLRGTTYNGPDFVVLTMAVGIIVAFSAAVVSYVLDRLFGVRFLSLMAQQATFVMVPPLFLIFLVLGTIFIGVATPTEGGAMGAAGAMLLAALKRFTDGNPARFNWTMIKSAVEATAKLSAFVLFILIGARIFSLTFYGVNGHLWVEHLLVSLPGGQIGFLVVVNILVFLLAFFLDFFELAFIVIPLLGPAAEKLGIDLIWFGVMLGVNMQTSFMHPPFGFALFYLRSVAPTEPYKDKITGKMTEPVTTGQIYYGAIPFVVIQCIMVGLVIAFPQMVMHYKSQGPTIDPSKVEIVLPGLGGAGGLPGLGTSPFGVPPGLGGPPPGLGGPPPGLGGLPPGLTPPPGLAPPPAVPSAPPVIPAPTSVPAAPPAPAAPAAPASDLPPPPAVPSTPPVIAAPTSAPAAPTAPDAPAAPAAPAAPILDLPPLPSLPPFPALETKKE